MNAIDLAERKNADGKNIEAVYAEEKNVEKSSSYRVETLLIVLCSIGSSFNWLTLFGSNPLCI